MTANINTIIAKNEPRSNNADIQSIKSEMEAFLDTLTKENLRLEGD